MKGVIKDLSTVSVQLEGLDKATQAFHKQHEKKIMALIHTCYRED